VSPAGEAPQRWPDIDVITDAAAGAGIHMEVSESFGDLTAALAPESWVAGLTLLRDECGLTYFDWLSAVDEGDSSGFSVFCHLADPDSHRHLLARTSLGASAPSLATATGVFRGAAWHERETHEMFGIDFPGHPHLVPLLLSDEFVGHPLRKDFVLTARVSKTWPGAKEPGEPGDGSPSRRKMQPPGVPDPSWGPRTGDGTDE
jgi:NADH:ubiquinone oxidoreductase subunit C